MLNNPSQFKQFKIDFLTKKYIFLGPNMIGTQFPFCVYLPQFMPDIIKIIYCGISALWSAHLVVFHDCLIIGLMIYICSQLQILKLNLRYGFWHLMCLTAKCYFCLFWFYYLKIIKCRFKWKWKNYTICNLIWMYWTSSAYYSVSK